MKNATTVIKKSYHGWMGETVTSVGNKDWKITTLKRSDGSISTIAQAGKLDTSDPNYTVFSFMMFQDKRVLLNDVKGRATSKKVGEVHDEGVKTFESYINEKTT